MTRYSGATWRPLGEQTQPRMKRHDIICLHTMVGTLTGTDRMFKNNGYSGTESHFGIGGKWGDGRDGEILQWQDTEFQADANLDGNHRIISIETGDNFPKRAADIEPWTVKQREAIARLIAYLCKTYDIPPVLVPDSKPSRRGIAYHRQGVKHSGGTNPPGFLQPGGEVWSSSIGKECPTPARIAQIPGILKRVKELLAPPAPAPKPKPQESDTVQPQELVELLDDAKITLGESASRNLGKDFDGKDNVVSLAWVLQWGDVNAAKVLADVAELQAGQAAQNGVLATILSEVRALKAGIAGKE